MPYILHNVNDIKRSKRSMIRYKKRWSERNGNLIREGVREGNIGSEGEGNVNVGFITHNPDTINSDSTDEQNNAGIPVNLNVINSDGTDEDEAGIPDDASTIRTDRIDEDDKPMMPDNPDTISSHSMDEDEAGIPDDPYTIRTDSTDEDDGAIMPDNLTISSNSTDKDDDANTAPEIKRRKIDRNPLRRKLRKWDTEFGCRRDAGCSLLRILKSEKDINNFNELPNDWRSVQAIPKDKIPFLSSVIEKCGGKYVYFGIEKNLKYLFKPTNTSTDTIWLVFNTDGVPLTESSEARFWPLLGRVKKNCVFIIALFYGFHEPDNFNVFLEDFVKESNFLSLNGIYTKAKHYNFRISYFTADTPAKASALNCKKPTGYWSCTRCKVEGQRICQGKKRSNIHFLDLNEEKRKSEDYNNPENYEKDYRKNEDDFHKGPTVLSTLEFFDCVSDVVIDNMHCGYGVADKVITALVNGFRGFPNKLPPVIAPSVRRIISEKLEMLALNNFSPQEFARKPRSLKYIHDYKGTERRQFLLYTGIAVLKGKIPEQHYYNFITLSVAIRYLNLYDDYSMEMVNQAKIFIDDFICTSRQLYGDSFVTNVVHALCHLPEDAFRFGKIDGASCFEFENFNFELGNAVESGNRPLEQVVNYWNKKVYDKIMEDECQQDEVDDSESWEFTHEDKNGKYYGLRLCKLHFRLNREGDRYCILSSGRLVQLESFGYEDDEVVIIGRPLQHVDSLFKKPCDSKSVGIYKCSLQPSSLTIIFSLEDIEAKLYPIPTGNNQQFIMIKLLH